MYSVGERIAKLRKQCGMTQEQLAELLQCSVQTEDGWESGGKEPDPGSLVRLADIFCTTTDELLGRRAGASAPRAAGCAVPADVPQSAPDTAQEGKFSGAFTPVSAGAEGETRRGLGRAEFALLVLLGICSGAVFLNRLLALFPESGVPLQILVNLAALAAALTAAAAAVLFFFVKAPSASLSARVLFFGGLALAAGWAAVYPFFTDNICDLIGADLFILGGLLLATFGAFFLFRPKRRLAWLRWLGCGAAAAGALFLALSLFFPRVRGFAVFNVVWQFVYIGLPWCQYIAGEGRAKSRDYAEENEMRRRTWWAKHRGKVLPVAFLLCFAAMLGLFSLADSPITAFYYANGSIPRIAIPCWFLFLVLPPAVFCLYFWKLKFSGCGGAARWSSYALWAACFALSSAFAYVDIFVYEELSPAALLSENILCAAAMLALFVWSLFLFSGKGESRTFRMAVPAAFIPVAAGGTAAFLWYILAYSIAGGTQFFAWFYVLLLFVLSFFLAERPPKAAKRDSTAAAKG